MADILIDNFGRKIDYLRLSVTDRCNLRCTYCMPREGVSLLKKSQLLSYEEIVESVKLLVELGIKKVRVTGGEPLVRKDIVNLIRSLKKQKEIEEISMTTNGLLLCRHLEELKKAGVERINISLDTLDEEKYRNITRGGEINKVLESLKKALDLKFKSIKINTVMSGILDEKDARDLVKLSMDFPVAVRFIEMMNPVYYENLVECSSSFSQEQIPPFSGIKQREQSHQYKSGININDIFGIMKSFGPYRKSSKQIGFGPSIYYKIKGSKGLVGFILNQNQVCSYCNRIRLTPDGIIRLCLFSGLEYNLREKLRMGISSQQIKKELIEFVKIKPQDRDNCSDAQNVSKITTLDKKTGRATGSRLKSTRNKEVKRKLAEYMSKVGG